ncbi:hypothetical protein ACWDPT_33170, partial [Nocardia sp. NPDC003644]
PDADRDQAAHHIVDAHLHRGVGVHPVVEEEQVRNSLHRRVSRTDSGQRSVSSPDGVAGAHATPHRIV